MANQDRYMIPIDTVLYCEHCRGYTDHSQRVYLDKTYSRCKVCGQEVTAIFRETRIAPSPEENSLTAISEELNNIVGSIVEHKWSENQGKKDRNFVSRLRERIVGVKRDVDKLR